MLHLEYADLEKRAAWVRRQVLDMVTHVGKGHIGGSLSCADILVALYYGGILKYHPHSPLWEERDRFILSKGHACAALYSILSDLGFFARSWIKDFNKEDSILEGHPHIGIPGIDVSTGSLGHGLGIGAGIALAAKMDEASFRVFVLMGDGECMEGSVWESAIFASSHKLNNLIVIVDRNGLFSTTKADNVYNVKNLEKQWKSFGWRTSTINGHNIVNICSLLSSEPTEKPWVIIANTVKGKGVSFMENKVEWHHKIPSNNEIWHARQELQIG